MSIQTCTFHAESNSFTVGKNTQVLRLDNTHAHATKFFKSGTLSSVFDVSYDAHHLYFTLQFFSQAISWANEKGLLSKQQDKIGKIFQHYVLENKADAGSRVSEELQSLGLQTKV